MIMQSGTGRGKIFPLKTDTGKCLGLEDIFFYDALNIRKCKWRLGSSSVTWSVLHLYVYILNISKQATLTHARVE